MMKKDCYNCKHLEWIDDEDPYKSGGYCCNKRDCNILQERRHLKQLSDEKYLSRPKICCDLRTH
jgi:hypothetical protein